MNSAREEVSLLNPDALVADGLDAAIIGYGHQFPKEPVLVYDYDKCVEVFMGQGMSREEAIEWMEFNVVSAYMGKGTPIFIKSTMGEDHPYDQQPEDWNVTPYGEKKDE